VPKRRGTIHSGAAPSGFQQSQQNMAANMHTSKSASPVVPHLPPPPPFMSNKIPDLLNRPSSAASHTSSLAHAFGSAEIAAQQQQQKQHDSRPSSQSGYGAMRPPSVASSTAVGSDTGTESDSSYRPSFKRLASQTLGPENTKRALLGPAGWDDDVVDDDDDDDGDFGRGSVSSCADMDQTGANKYADPLNRPMVGLSDRNRKVSCPTTTDPSSVPAGVPLAPSLARAEEAVASGS